MTPRLSFEAFVLAALVASRRARIKPRVAAAVQPQTTPHAPARGAPPGNGLKKSELAAELHVTTAHLHRVADGLVQLTLLQACAIADLLGLELRCSHRAPGSDKQPVSLRPSLQGKTTTTRWSLGPSTTPTSRAR